MRRAALLVGALAALVAAAACAQGSDEPAFGELEGEPSAGPPPSSEEHGGFGDAGPDFFERSECEEATKQIFVLATDRGLYRFDPEPLTFTRVGTLTCPSAAGTFSMAIDRRGIAWVEFTDGRLFATDTRDARCIPTAFRHGQKGFEVFGMGFAKNDDGTGEKLYVAGAGLAELDTRTFELTFLGSLSFGRTELTAIDTELYGFAAQSGVIAGLDKSTGSTKTVHRTTAVDERAAFAFAHWGGDFYVFTGQTTSKVTRYSPDADTSAVVVPNTGMLIVGAGSSTCAPTTRPK